MLSTDRPASQPSSTHALLEQHNLRPQKKFGQNFLINPVILSNIADAATEEDPRGVLEIGPGTGSLTKQLSERAAHVCAVEIDTSLAPVLEETLKDTENVHVVFDDFMKCDLAALLEAEFPDAPPYSVAVCANLPYYITTPILMKLLESGYPFENITIMIQSEVADRLSAPAGSPEYGAITAAVAYYGEPATLFRVAPGNFLPPPKVTSSVVRIRLFREKPNVPRDEALLFSLIRAAFAQRRKTLVNALSAAFPAYSKQKLTEIITSCGHKPDIRGEKLDIAAFTRLADHLSELSNP